MHIKPTYVLHAPKYRSSLDWNENTIKGYCIEYLKPQVCFSKCALRAFKGIWVKKTSIWITVITHLNGQAEFVELQWPVTEEHYLQPQGVSTN